MRLRPNSDEDAIRGQVLRRMRVQRRVKLPYSLQDDVVLYVRRVGCEEAVQGPDFGIVDELENKRRAPNQRRPSKVHLGAHRLVRTSSAPIFFT